MLGPLAVDGVDVGLAPRDRVVLSALATRRGEACAADRIADALWPQRPPATWAKIVQGCVVRLRKTLGAGSIDTVPNGYRLTVPAEEVDAAVFERLVVRAREMLAIDEPERASYFLAQALELWRGPALPDLAEWHAGQVEALRLDELRLEAEELRLEAALRAGRHGEVLAEARERVDEAPARERRWALLALTLYRTGQQAEALQTLRQVRTVLADELGLDPGPELVALERLHPPAGAVPARGARVRGHQSHLPLPGPGGVRRERCGRLLRARDAGGDLPRRTGGARGAGRGRSVRQRQVLAGPRRHRGLPRAQRTRRRRHLARSAPDGLTGEPPSLRIAARGRPGRGSLHDVRRPGRTHGVLRPAGRPGVERRTGARPPGGPDGRCTRSP